MDNQLYEYSPISERAPRAVPNGARVATNDEIADWYYAKGYDAAVAQPSSRSVVA